MDRPIIHIGRNYNLAALSPCGLYVLAGRPDGTLDTFSCADVLFDDNAASSRNRPIYKPRQGPVHSYSQGSASIRCLQPSRDPRGDFLVAAVDHPVQLLSGWTATASYSKTDGYDIKPRVQRSWNLRHGTQDAYLFPYAMDFNYSAQDDMQLIVGADKTIAIFDGTESGEPLHRRALGSSFEKSVGPEGPTFLSGSISALACNHQLGLVAAGSHTRGIAVFDNHGSGRSVLSFSLKGSKVAGAGVSHLRWSLLRPWYLYVAERDSDCALLYDVRMTVSKSGSFVQPLAVMTGRDAYGQLKLGLNLTISQKEGGMDHAGDCIETLVCGGSDGHIRGWEDAWATEADEALCSPDWARQIDGCGITEILIHPDGGLITCAAEDRRVRTQEEWWETESGSETDSCADTSSADTL